MAMPPVLVVGAGVTGSVLAMLLKQMGVPVRIMEKEARAGGRMATHHLSPGPGFARADLGAQYITTRSSKEHTILGPIYHQLIDSGVLSPFTGEIAGPNPYGGGGDDGGRPREGDEIRHFSAKEGLASISQHFLNTAGVLVDHGSIAEELMVDQSGTVKVKMQDGTEEKPGIIVMTQPVLQVLGSSEHPIKGNFLEYTDESVMTSLKKVSYSSRFAVAYFFDPVAFPWPYTWAAKYFDKGHVRYVAGDTIKRGAQGENLLSVVVHSGVPLGIEHLDDEEPYSAATSKILAELHEKMPELPWQKAHTVEVLKWRYSQVYKGYGNARPKPDWIWGAEVDSGTFPGTVKLFETEKSLGLLSGDAFAPASNFEGCVYSAHQTAAAIRSWMSARKFTDL
eukprot:gnl/MRDRNA2_/MRDRNA2_95171_c0_seq1.p1 gnl/MRDRNA2_/MRDRNA2_95171_c0~~gnl/MRDRNA2_/MRDRNA2_95171_c0_seq1.p1  ORF type:complete len:394 (+),score=69.05 gnl/MRDRNA2_/MRDRNA2_95171_c0_seq1:64-1245(+)